MEQDNQLLKDFSDTEKGAYLSAVASIATADRKATDDEIQFLEALIESADLPAEQEQAVIAAAKNLSAGDLQANLDVLKNSQLRFSLLTDIISFAKSDGQYTSEEQDRVKDIASYLNIDQTQFNVLNQFVNTAETAQKEGQDISQPAFMESSGLGNIFKNSGISPNILKGALAVMGPILLSRMMSGGRRGGGMPGGGLLGGLLGGLAGNTFGRGGGMMGGNSGGGMFGGLGSLFSIFGGNRGYGGFGGAGSGLGSVLGGLLGGGRRGGGMF